MTFSWTNVMSAYHQLGVQGWKLYVTPMSVDFWVLLGMVLRMGAWSQATRRLGMRMQITAGVISLSANVYAGHSLGDRIFDGAMVFGYMAAELLCSRIVTRAAEQAETRQAETRQATTAELAAAEAERAERNRKDRERRAAKRQAEQAAQAEAAAKRQAAAERRRLARQVRELEAVVAGPSAPVSPAPFESNGYL
jgi:hypothetical protein